VNRERETDEGLPVDKNRDGIIYFYCATQYLKGGSIMVKSLRLVGLFVFLTVLLGMASSVFGEISVFNNENPAAVQNNPTNPTVFTLREPMTITYIRTYHWNGGKGQPLGTISLRNELGKVFGPYSTTAYATYWVAKPNLVFPAGTYTIIDSHPASWAHNSQSGGRGFAAVNGEPLSADEKGRVQNYFQSVGDQKGPVKLQTIPR
jgi:hypothetical protein